ncbi:MAG: L-aspartate oxidase [Nitrospirae bacterium]|nr:L-aspartate oxidase [Nitrospirota bacterium]
METLITDFLVIGSGVAGLRAAVELARAGDVWVVTKDEVAESSTEYAQGGVAVALSDEDRVGIHFEDTIKAGDGLCREEAVRVLVEEGPERILELIRWGAEFDKKGTKLDFTLEAAHTRKRVLHAHGDSTGKEIERVLINRVKQFENIKRMPFSMGMELIVKNGKCCGAYVVHKKRLLRIVARATVLATGGGGQIFARTTNPSVATADGMAMALRAGAVLEDMEFIQFHPTVLYAPGAPQFLLSEAMRGEGGVLRNIYGERFMERYHPDQELAPRDVVSRAIISEMVKTKSTHVYLDLTHLDGAFLKRRFPRIYRTCLMYDLDITRDRIPVSPAAHYTMGGVKTDTMGRTSIKGLFAAGEVACTGVHGANRLASNSLLEGLVYGARAGRAAVEEALKETDLKDVLVAESIDSFGNIEEIADVRTRLRRVMWERVGIIRCNESLSIARKELERLRPITEKNYLTRQELELKNMINTAEVVTESAIQRRCSIGAHYRSDFKEKASCFYHTLVRYDDGRINISRELLKEDS